MLERFLHGDNKPLNVAKTFIAGIKPFCATIRNTIELCFQMVNVDNSAHSIDNVLVFCNANVQPIQTNANNEQYCNAH